MTYVAVPYTDIATVKRLLRTQNSGTIKIGTQDNDELSPTDVALYILDASMFIDSIIRKSIKTDQFPLTATYPEIAFAAGRLTAFFIYRDFFGAYRMENLPMGPRGWTEDAKEFIKIFIDNLNSGVYPTLSPATDGPSWETTEQWFINKVGNYAVRSQLSMVTNQVPTDGDNLGPYGEPN
jgi:hypothetical protein